MRNPNSYIVKSFRQLASDFEKNLSLISFLGPSLDPLDLQVVGCSNGFWFRAIDIILLDILMDACTTSATRIRDSHCQHPSQIQGPYWRPNSLNADIFTSETGQWNRTVVYLPQCYKDFELDVFFPTIAHGGKLYMKGRSNDSILVYDPFHGDNQFHVLPLTGPCKGNRVEENHLLGYFKIRGIPAAPKGVPKIVVIIEISTANALTVYAALKKLDTGEPTTPAMDVKMPLSTVNDGHIKFQMP
ncbi:hypothetical protein L6164_022853 [Bauhinia variegata]|uniref:Uncharacterized protein n=1 Tax=Bauhinia variegata TaxID=167791 RepID=A0ACB9MHR7_BAUVA|nr:hypothetical protein L6164_022853 [Bauhinia variegata]